MHHAINESNIFVRFVYKNSQIVLIGTIFVFEPSKIFTDSWRNGAATDDRDTNSLLGPALGSVRPFAIKLHSQCFSSFYVNPNKVYNKTR